MATQATTFGARFDLEYNDFVKGLKTVRTRVRQFSFGFAKQIGISDKALLRLRRSMDRLGKGSKLLIRGLNSFTRRGLLVATAAATGFAVALNKSVTALDDIGKAAARVNLQPGRFQELTFAVQRSGGEIQNLESGIRAFNNAIGSAGISGGGEFIQFFNQLGVQVVGDNGALRETADVLDDVADGFANMTNETERAFIAARLFGEEAGGTMLQVLRDGRSGLRAFADEARRMGIILNDDVIAQAERTRDAIDNFGTSLRSVGIRWLSNFHDEAEALGAYLNGVLIPAVNRTFNFGEGNTLNMNFTMPNLQRFFIASIDKMEAVRQAILRGLASLIDVLRPMLVFFSRIETTLNYMLFGAAAGATAGAAGTLNNISEYSGRDPRQWRGAVREFAEERKAGGGTKLGNRLKIVGTGNLMTRLALIGATIAGLRSVFSEEGRKTAEAMSEVSEELRRSAETESVLNDLRENLIDAYQFRSMDAYRKARQSYYDNALGALGNPPTPVWLRGGGDAHALDSRPSIAGITGQTFRLGLATGTMRGGAARYDPDALALQTDTAQFPMEQPGLDVFNPFRAQLVQTREEMTDFFEIMKSGTVESIDKFGIGLNVGIEALAKFGNANSRHARQAFHAQKAAAIGSSLVNTYAGVAASLKEGGILGYTMAALTFATGMAQIAAIKSTTFGGGGGGRTSLPSIGSGLAGHNSLNARAYVGSRDGVHYGQVPRGIDTSRPLNVNVVNNNTYNGTAEETIALVDAKVAEGNRQVARAVLGAVEQRNRDGATSIRRG